MRIADVLKSKGDAVTTLDATTTVRELVDVLGERGIGAVVVISGDAGLAGMVSERDVVRCLRENSEQLLDQPLSDIMTSDVVVCSPTDLVDEVLATMTDRRIRHLPVVDEGRLSGLISIGDLVKSRIGELQHERDQLSAYVTGANA